MNLYLYKGPVMSFDRVIDRHFEGSTYAVSKKKARSNLEYQYKKKHGLSSGAKITLSGDVVLADEDIAS